MLYLTKSFKDFNKFEKYWLLLFSTIIILTTLYFSAISTNYTKLSSVLLNWVIAPLSGLTGVFCVVLCAKGKIQNYIWGILNAILYGWVAWVSGYYGDWLVNWFFFLPAQFFIFFLWRKHVNVKAVVDMQRLRPWLRVVLALILIVATYAFAIFLTGIDNFFTRALKRSSAFYINLSGITGFPLLGPLMDSSTVVLQVIAEILLIFRFAEQWILWIAVDLITPIIWIIVIATDRHSWAYAIPTLVMWLAFLVNSIYGALVWYRWTK